MVQIYSIVNNLMGFLSCICTIGLCWKSKKDTTKVVLLIFRKHVDKVANTSLACDNFKKPARFCLFSGKRMAVARQIRVTDVAWCHGPPARHPVGRNETRREPWKRRAAPRRRNREKERAWRRGTKPSGSSHTSGSRSSHRSIAPPTKGKSTHVFYYLYLFFNEVDYLSRIDYYYWCFYFPLFVNSNYFSYFMADRTLCPRLRDIKGHFTWAEML